MFASTPRNFQYWTQKQISRARYFNGCTLAWELSITYILWRISVLNFQPSSACGIWQPSTLAEMVFATNLGKPECIDAHLNLGKGWRSFSFTTLIFLVKCDPCSRPYGFINLVRSRSFLEWRFNRTFDVHLDFYDIQCPGGLIEWLLRLRICAWKLPLDLELIIRPKVDHMHSPGGSWLLVWPLFYGSFSPSLYPPS